MNKQKQNGSVHIVIISVIVVILLGTVGFLFWKNFINKASNPKPNASNASQSAPNQSPSSKPDTTKFYQNDQFSFEYPAGAWQVSEIQYGVNGEKPTVVVRTSDYVQTGMGLDAGAEVSINVSPRGDTLANRKQAVIDFAGGVVSKDVADTKVSGVDAFSFNSTYEGPRYHTVFLYKEHAYDIVYQYPMSSDSKTYMAGYRTVVDSFKLK